MPELTVSMPAYNTAKYIRRAIESVLDQTGIDFELIVVDDASQDNTAAVVLSFKDPRVKLLTNKINRGIPYCHNLVIKQSTSPFIAHVDSDDLILPHAFQKLVQKLKSHPNIGQVHCYYLEITDDGRMTSEPFETRKQRFQKQRPADMDYKRELLVQGTVTNHLRTYRRAVFDVVGCFNESVKYGEDYEMALRIIDRFDIKLVPEFLYCLRLHGNRITNRMGFTTGLHFFLNRLWICRQLSKNNQLGFLNERKYNLNRLMLESFFRILRDSYLNLVSTISVKVRAQVM